MQHGPSGPERAGMVPELSLSGDISCTHGTEYAKIARMKKIVFLLILMAVLVLPCSARAATRYEAEMLDEVVSELTRYKNQMPSGYEMNSGRWAEVEDGLRYKQSGKEGKSTVSVKFDDYDEGGFLVEKGSFDYSYRSKDGGKTVSFSTELEADIIYDGEEHEVEYSCSGKIVDYFDFSDIEDSVKVRLDGDRIDPSSISESFIFI